MSDDRQEPPAGDPDATRALPPDRPAGDAGRGAPADADATQALPPERGGVADADATRAMPATGGAAGPRPPDATRPMPGGAARPDRAGATAPLPPAWSGRAGVPTRPAAYHEPGAEWYAEEQAGRRWWMPILLGILALLLVALIGLGVWLGLRATERNPAPTPSPTAVPTSAPRTSAAPTTTAPSSSPPTTPPSPSSAEVPMPPLVGLPESAARAILDRLGVDYRVETRESDRPAGTVLATDPAAGEPIADGDRVTLVVAERATPTTAAGTTTAGPTATATP
ncbi:MULTISPECIES: PASTA domain-containing protein [Micromonospora]|uniref:PASTA domain-containing protein n=1 Tax=Micromonospora solifontis TaxID=2487138 RepID=A0ABX9WCF9_9ACTN|nr:MULTISPECIES: PASTA domain-containing protein [Micromonospora]NES15916.1 PASTA domain-containing protein [Micromonospora sp. PPF5-17B]NES38966.1 PASTA domain-containing protein [Micromonospora solifontis]NES57907.1 PASTA domain-containing protein [Micromonospora sp. PPF5-6]RNL92257.1 PASTA domain-containing protein [Micromonospora solifontis]